MNSTAVAILIAVISSSALSTFISKLMTAKSDKKNEYNALVVAMRQLYYGRIKRHAKAYIAAGQITAEELEDIIEEHRIYHDILGGNGYLDALMAEVKALQIIG